MTNHPNRSRRGSKPSPTPDEIRAARAAAGLTQCAAAELIYATTRAWEDWEGGRRSMHPAMFELFLAKTLQTTLKTWNGVGRTNS